jgi:urease accessory protein
VPTTAGTSTITNIEPLALLRLFHLVSPALPVGAYAYSQGLEYAVQAGWVADEEGTFDWLQGLSRHTLGTLDLPILLRLHAAWQANDPAALERWNGELIAARETAELRAEERHLGTALARVLIELDIAEARAWLEPSPAFATMFSLARTRCSRPSSWCRWDSPRASDCCTGLPMPYRRSSSVRWHCRSRPSA